VEAALLARRRALRRLHLKAGPASPALERLRALAAAAAVPVHEGSLDELEALARGGHHQGAVLECGPLPLQDEASALAPGRAWAQTPAEARRQPPPLLLALDQVEDPRNLGAVVRSAAAFGAAGLVYPRDHSAPLSAVASSASAGALEHFPLHAVANLARFLEQAKEHGFWIAGTAVEGGQRLPTYVHDRPLVLVLGNEGRGLRPLVARACDLVLSIPLARPPVQGAAGLDAAGQGAAGPGAAGPGAAGPDAGRGLNVASAAAVLLYHLTALRPGS
jgi:23S rRNA (guanosine2251-2'-O)-methyltransferase